MTKIKVGVVGAGQIAREVHLPVLRAIAQVDIAWLADSHEESAQSIAKAYGVPFATLKNGIDGLPACDIALLAIPVHARADYYAGFSKQNIGVFAEKPFAIGGADHVKFASQFQDHEAACGYMKRFFSSTIAIKQMIRNQLFGPIKKIRISDGVRATRTGRDFAFQDKPYAEGGGVLLQVGCHGLDLGCFLCEAKEYEVSSSQVEWDEETDRRIEAQIVFSDVFGQTEECVFEFHSSWLDTKDPGVQIEFEHASIRVAGLPNAPILVKDSNGGSQYTITQDNSGAHTIYQAFYLEWIDFLENWKNETESLVSVKSSQITSNLMTALIEKGMQ